MRGSELRSHGGDVGDQPTGRGSAQGSTDILTPWFPSFDDAPVDAADLMGCACWWRCSHLGEKLCDKSLVVMINGKGTQSTRGSLFICPIK